MKSHCIRATATALAAAAALGAALPAAAQDAATLLEEVKALKARVEQLEKKLADTQAKPAAAPGQWGMTPEQQHEFDRISVKTESLQDNFIDQGLQGLKIGGYMDPAFIWNQRQSRAGFQFLNHTSDGYSYDTSFIGAAVIEFTKETDGGSIFKLTLSPNRSAGAVAEGIDNIVQEASVSIPLTDLQTRFIAGQLPDWSGYEYQQPTLNPFITHNLLFDFTLPAAYTGAGIDWTSGKWWVRGLIANVNEPIRKFGEREPALVYRVDYSKGEYDGFGFAGLFGKTTNYNLWRMQDDSVPQKSMTMLFELDGYFIRGDLTLQGQVSYGWQKQGGIMPNADGSFPNSRWWGLSGLAGWNFTPRLQGLVRADYLNDRRGGGGLFTYNGYFNPAFDPADPYGVDGPYGDYRNGIGPDPTLGCDSPAPALPGDCHRGANRWALSFGLKYLFNEFTTFKLEYRLDGADLPVFYDLKADNYKKTNNLLGASVLLAF